MSDKKEPSTTTISTIAVQSGQTRIVIALLQVKEWIELKVLEVTPSLTLLGDTLQEAHLLRDTHYEVIQKVQSKKSPVDELLRQADEAMKKQDDCRPEVYAAMAQSLSAVWNNVNSHLEDRRRILDLNCNYHSCADAFEERCIEIDTIIKSGLPIEIDDMKERLNRLKEVQREMLVTMNRALHQGNSLLDVIGEIKEEGTLDSRPGQIRLQAELAKCQVERWLERLHERRDWTLVRWEEEKRRLEQCLALALITADLTMLFHLLSERTESLLRSTDQLGDAHASAQLLLHEHRKLIPEAKDLQEQALKIVKVTEDFASEGHFAGPEAISQAYQLLETAATYLHHIDQRESTLCRSIDFFNNAQSAMIKLDQLEVQLTTGELGLKSTQLEQLHSTIAKSLEDVTASPLQEGYSLLQDVPGAEGVKRMVEQMENKKINLSVQCTAHKEENVKANRIYTSFLEKYEQLIAWLTSMGAYLHGLQDMGSNLALANDFLQINRTNLNDLQVKGNEIHALLSTVPSVCESLDSMRREEVEEKGEALRKKWTELKSELEKRTELGASYVKAHDLCAKLGAELDSIEKLMKSEDGSEADGRQSWATSKQLHAQLKNTTLNFSADSKKVSSLDGERARLCLETCCEHFEGRLRCLETAWELWLNDRQDKLQNNTNWERNMQASNKTVDWVSKLDAQLYPILSEDLHSARQLVSHVEHKQNTVLPEIKRAQQEIQLRIETAEALLSKGGITVQHEGVPIRLRELNSRLQTISTDYQVLLEKLMTFFNSLSQLETRIESVQREEQAGIGPQTFNEAEASVRDFEATKRSISDSFNIAIVESGHIINKIKMQETNSTKDVGTVERVLEVLRYDWQKVREARERTLERHLRKCQFDLDLQEIYRSLEQLSQRLEENRGQYGDSLASARASSNSFNNFQQIITVLEDRIIKFTTSGEEMIGKDGGDHIERELFSLRQRWLLFKEQISQTRQLIDLTIKYFTLVEEAEDWFREGNRLLVSIARRSTHVTTVQEASELLTEIELFLKPGEDKQYQRIDEISRLGDQLQSKGCFPHLSQVKSESKDMLESFSQVSSDLKILCDKLQRPSPVKEIMKEVVETDGTQKTEFITTDHHTSTHTSQVIHKTIIHKIEINREEAEPMPLVFEVEKSPSPLPEKKKSPSPPPKKVKLVERAPTPVQAPYFSIPLQDATIDEGSKFTFKCRVTGHPVPEISWEKDGISILNNPDYQTKFSPEEGLCSLSIEETFCEDSASFICRATNSAGSSETRASLTVRESIPEEQVSPPVFITPLSTVTLLEGANLELKCLVGGVPLPTVQWYYEKQCLDNDPKYSITFNNGEALLVKEQVSSDDQGVYSCTATNPLGSETSMAKLNILRKEPSEVPRFSLELGNVMARAGQKIKLECEAIGKPEPELTWTHDGKPIKENRDIKIWTEKGKSRLLINEAFPKDAGTYRVSATNSAGSSATSCQVTVKGLLPTETSDSELASDMEPIKPTIQIQLKDQSVFEGKKVRLDCVIIGHPEPEVIWYHDERPVKESSDIQLMFQGDRCSLVIKEAFLEDAGHYKVVAINSAGEASSSCSLIVQAIDKSGEHATRQPVTEVTEPCVDGSPRFSKMLTDILATQGDTVLLECVVSGIPSPTVTWALNNQDLQQSNRTHMIQDSDGNCSLKIMGVLPEDKGVYTAKATNQQGEAKCFAQLIVKTPVTLDSVSAPPQQEEKHTPPVFTELFSDRAVAEGESTKFECIVTGKPTPKVRWLFNDIPVSGKDFLVSTSGNRQVLTIPKPNLDHCGKVTCVAENDAGKVSCVAILSIYESAVDTFLPPTSVESMNQSESSVFEVKRSVFSQSTSSSSSHQFSSVSSSGAAEPIVKIESHVSKSEMASQKIGDQPAVQFESHKTKDYSNICGVEQSSESEVVKSTAGGEAFKMIKSQRKSTPPRFISPINGCIVDLGAQVTLEAIIEGHPTPTVTWSKNGGGCPPEAETSWSVGKAVFILKDVKTSDSGKYTCTAENEAGSAAATADVVVRKSSFPPVMGKRLQGTMGVVGERICLEIEVTGTPNPTVVWSKDGQPIPSSTSMYRITSSGNTHSLIIDKAEHCHSGQYCASASNCAGESKSLADLIINEPLQQMPQPSLEMKFQDLNLPKLPTFPPSSIPTQESILVSESFKSEKQVSMKVEQSSQAVDFGQIKHVHFDPGSFKEGVRKEETLSQDSTIESSSIPKKSALDYFKNIIKENEDEPKPKPSVPPAFSMFPQAETKFSPQAETKFSSQDSFQESLTSSFLSQTGTGTQEFLLEPGPPPEICFVEKSATPKPKEDIGEKVKKLQESHRRLSNTEIPPGGVKIFPTAPEVSSVQRKEVRQEFESRKQVEIVKPSVEGLSMEKLWTGRVQESKTIEFPRPQIEERVESQSKSFSQSSLEVKQEVERSISPSKAKQSWPPVFTEEPSFIAPEQILREKSASPFKPKQNWQPVLPKPSSPKPRESSASPFKPKQSWPPVFTEEVVSSAQSSSSVQVQSSSFQMTKQEQSREVVSGSSFLPVQSSLEAVKQVAREQSASPSKPKQSWPPVFTEQQSTSQAQSSFEMKQESSRELVTGQMKQERGATPTKPKQSWPPVFTEGDREVETRSPKPSSEGLAMDKLWAHKLQDSTVKQSWPPIQESKLVVESQSSASAKEQKEEFRTTVKESIEEKKAVAPSFGDVKPVDPNAGQIIYVAEARASHSTNLINRQEITEKVSSSQSLQQESSSRMEQIVGLEPGPPPIMGFATPPPKERRQSYVEMIEQGLERDLEREPTRVPVGGVRTIPPPRRDSDLLRRSSSLSEAPKPVQTQPQQKYDTLPRPSKFVKKGFESDYESDVDSMKFKSRWTPYDSDTDTPAFRKVEFTPPPSRARSVQSEATFAPPTEPPLTLAPRASSSFSSLEKKEEQKIETRVSTSAMTTAESSFEAHKITPIVPKLPSVSPSPKPKQSWPPVFVEETPLVPGPPPQYLQTNYESGYMADTDEPHRSTARFQQQQQQQAFLSKTEKKSTFSSTQSFEKKEMESSKFLSQSSSVKRMSTPEFRPKFEPIEKPITPVKLSDIIVKPLPVTQFPTKKSKEAPRPQPEFDLKPGSPPKMDYAPPLQRGPGSAVETSNFVNFAEATESSRRVVSMQQTTRVINFHDQQQQRTETFPTKIIPKGDAKWATDSDKELSELEMKAEERRLKRVDEMRKRFGDKANTVTAQAQKFEYSPTRVPQPAAFMANKQMSEMTSSFKTKAQQFMTDIIHDVKENGEETKAKEEPQAYREESRHSEYGTKHIDPDTGLIYFKYDFGYEFGVVMPGEAKPGTQIKSPQDKEGCIEVPVLHETTKPVGPPPPPKQEVQTETAEKSKFEAQRQSTTMGYESSAGGSHYMTPSPSSISPSFSPYPTHGQDLQGSIQQSWAKSTSPYPDHTPQVVSAMNYLEQKKAPMFIAPLRNIAVVCGNPARFECIVQAEPSPNISWSKDGVALKPSPQHEIHFRNGVCRLTIPQAFPFNAGIYSCTASNPLGRQDTSAQLQVSGEGRTYISI